MTNLQRRLAGCALAVGGALVIVGFLAAGILAGGSGDAHFIDPLFQPLYVIALAGTILTVLGFPAILAVQEGRFPRLTVVGYACLLTGLLMLNLGEGVIEGFVKPYLATHGGIPKDPSGFAAWQVVALVGAVVGAVCLGVAMLRAGTMPRWIPALLIGGMFLSFVVGSMRAPFDAFGDDVMNVAFIAIGWRVAVPARRGLATPQATAHDAGRPNAALAGASLDR